MPTVDGIYDGEVVRPLEPLKVAPNTRVAITLPECDAGESDDLLDRLERKGMIYSRPRGKFTAPPAFKPIRISGPPLSQTVIEDRGNL